MWKEELHGIGERFADAYSLPKDMVVNATLFHIIGKNDIYLENFKGIISYTCHEILIKGYDCKYCINRKSNNVKRAIFTPEEICYITITHFV